MACRKVCTFMGEKMHNRLERIERYLVALIQRRGPDKNRNPRDRMVLWGLRQLSYIYLALVQTRHFLYCQRILRPHTLGCQVISIGNLTVGGTGKTPVVEVLARELKKQGRRVAILSRGYKKVEPGFLKKMYNRFLLPESMNPPRVVSDGKKLLLDSAMSGDEPYMLASNLQDVAVLVDKDRVKSGRYAINKLGCDTLILDDGFQYLALKHRVEIVLVDRTNPFANEHVLPRGLLREPVGNIKRANFIFITKSDGTDQTALKERLRSMNPKAEIIECRHSPRYLRNVYTAERKELDFLRNLRVVALSGIAVPAGFENELEKHGAEIVDKHRFADHHRYEQQEILDLVNDASRLGAQAIITTEKDAVRLPSLARCDVPIYFLRVDIEILTGKEDFHACIRRICFQE
jgi:tetraacyldisaccharide 4'-kinase